MEGLGFREGLRLEGFKKLGPSFFLGWLKQEIWRIGVCIEALISISRVIRV